MNPEPSADPAQSTQLGRPHETVQSSVQLHRMTPSMIRVRKALEASWIPATAYRGAVTLGVPSLGQCYPTSRVLQLLHPALEIVEGRVWTGTAEEKHFWNLLDTAVGEVHVDLTWQQFPHGSVARDWHVRDRATLNDSDATLQRVDVLLQRVHRHLDQRER